MSRPIGKDAKDNITIMIQLGMTVGEIQALYPKVSSGTIRTLIKDLNCQQYDNIDNVSNRYKERNNQKIQEFLQRYIEKYGDMQDVSKAKLLITTLNDREVPRKTRKMKEQERNERVKRILEEKSEREEER